MSLRSFFAAIASIGAMIPSPWQPLFAVAAMALNHAEARAQRKKARQRALEAYNASLKDRLLTVQSDGNAARQIVLGRVRAGGVMVRPPWTTGANSEKLTLVLAFAGHEIDAFEKFWFDDVEVTLNGSGYVTTEPYQKTRREITQQSATLDGSGGYVFTMTGTPIDGTVRASWTTGTGDNWDGGGLSVSVVGNQATVSGGPAGATGWLSYEYDDVKWRARVRTYLGTTTQSVGTDLSAEYPGKLLATDHFCNIALAVVDLEYDQDVFPTGIPNISALMRGAKVLDPRLNYAINPTLSGAVIGGIPATGLSFSNGNGYTMAVTGFGVEAGMNYIDVRVSGTSVATGGCTFWLNSITNANWPAAASGETWRAGVYIRLIANSLPVSGATLQLLVRGRSSGGTNLESTATVLTSALLSASRLDLGLNTVSRTLNNASTAKSEADIIFTASTGSVVADFTVRIGLHYHSKTDHAIKWSENPALLAYHYARHPNGWAVPGQDIRTADVSTAATACDVSTNYQMVMPDTTIDTVTLPRFVCGIAIATDAAPGESMDEIIESMAGRVGWAGGVLRMRAGALGSTVFNMDASWVAQRLNANGTAEDGALVRIVSNQPRQSRINKVTGTCVDSDQRYQALPFPLVQDATLIATMGELALDVQMMGVRYIAHAQQLAKILIRESQAGLRMEAQCNISAYRCELFDVGSVTIDRYGFSAKLFEVLGWRWHPTEGVTLRLAETSADIYSLENLTGRDPAPNTVLPSPWNVATLTGLAVSSNTTALTDGSVISRAIVTWTASAQQSVRVGGSVEVQYAEATATLTEAKWNSWSEQGSNTQAIIPGLLGGRPYLFRARFIQGVPQVSGPWSAAVLHTIGAKRAPLAFYQDTEPTDAIEGDVWVDTNDGNKLYIHNGTSFQSARDTTIATAQSTANGKIKTFIGTSAPTAEATGDIWFDTDDGNKQYRWDGDSWEPVQDGAIVTTGYRQVRVYKRASSAPSTPTGNGVPSGWSLDLPPYNGIPGWYSDATQDAGGTTVGSWSTPARADAGPIAVLGDNFCYDSALDPADAAVSFDVRRNGNLYQVADATDTLLGAWYSPSATDVGDAYEVKFTKLWGDNPTGGSALYTWHALTSTRYVEMVVTTIMTKTCYLQVTIRNASTGAAVSTGNVLLEATVEV